jgi:hypothetical protein
MWRVDDGRLSSGGWFLNQGGVVGVNGLLIAHGQAKAWTKELEPRNVTLKPLHRDLVDEVWKDQPARPGASSHCVPGASGRRTLLKMFYEAKLMSCVCFVPPAPVAAPVRPHALEYAGRSIEDKLLDIRSKVHTHYPT